MSVLADIRPKQLLRDMIKPPKKEDVKTRNLAYLRLVTADKSKSVLFVSLPSSGWNWCCNVASYALLKHFTGSYDVSRKEARNVLYVEERGFDLQSPADSRSRNRKPLRQKFPELDIDYFFHTHGNWKESALWGLDEAKTIMIARDPMTSLYSFTTKRRGEYGSFEECLEKTGFLERTIKYYNSWARYKKKYPERFFVFKYEDFKADPVPRFRDLIKTAFGVEIPDELVAEAVEYYDFDKRKKLEEELGTDKKSQYHFKGKTSYREEMGEANYHRLSRVLNERLLDQFGYEF